MYFKPIDEMSLRHLFSTDFAKSQLKLAYVNPVINSSGGTESSPDSLVVDMRGSPYKIKRCEFKLAPENSSIFSHNGNFDIAIIWDYGKSTDKNKLSQELFHQNKCVEIIALSEYKAFKNLPLFDYKYFESKKVIEDVKGLLLKRELHSVVAAYIAAKIYPKPFSIDSLKKYLAKKYKSVESMSQQGRGNIITAFMQTRPPLIKHMNTTKYRWNDEFDHVVSASSIASTIFENFSSEVPSQDDIDEILNGE